jgi:hypothetical protein
MLIAKREGYRGDVLETALDGNTHRTTVVRIYRSIIAMINTANHHIGLTLADIGQRHLYTVNGGTITTPHLYPLLFPMQIQAQRDTSREGTRVAAAGIIGCTNYDIGYILQHIYQAINTFCLIAVIVRNEQ